MAISEQESSQSAQENRQSDAQALPQGAADSQSALTQGRCAQQTPEAHRASWPQISDAEWPEPLYAKDGELLVTIRRQKKGGS